MTYRIPEAGKTTAATATPEQAMIVLQSAFLALMVTTIIVLVIAEIGNK